MFALGAVLASPLFPCPTLFLRLPRFACLEVVGRLPCIAGVACLACFAVLPVGGVEGPRDFGGVGVGSDTECVSWKIRRAVGARKRGRGLAGRPKGGTDAGGFVGTIALRAATQFGFDGFEDAALARHVGSPVGGRKGAEAAGRGNAMLAGSAAGVQVAVAAALGVVKRNVGGVQIVDAGALRELVRVALQAGGTGLRPRGQAAAAFVLFVTGGLALGAGVRFGDFAFFAARHGFGEGGGFGAAGGFDPFGGGAAGGRFGFAQGMLTIDAAVVIFGCGGDAFGFARDAFGFRGGGFGLLLGLQFGLTEVFGGAMAHLRPVFPTRSRKIPVFGTVKIGPGVQNGYIFGCFREQIVGIVAHLRIHRWFTVGAACRPLLRW